MNKMKLSWGWYFMISFSFCAFAPSERRIEGIIEGRDLNGLVRDRTGQENQIHHSTIPTLPHPLEMHFEGNNVYANNMQERVKALESFAPLNEESKHVANPRPLISELIDIVTGLVSPWTGTSAIGELCTTAERYPSRMNFMVTELRRLRLDDAIGIRLVPHEQLEKILVNLLEFLQQEDLESYDKLWSLNLLRSLQSLLPIGMLNPIREDPNTGGVSRGGLELFLLKELDYKLRVKGLINGKIQVFPVDEAVTEALKRVELIVNIRNHISSTERNLQTSELSKIHDQLLQNRSLNKPGIIESLALKSIHHTFLGDTPNGEIQCYAQIMEHLQLFYPAAKQFGITEGSRRFKLRTKIRVYLQDSDRNHQTHGIKQIYDKLLHTKSLDDALIVRSLVLKSLQHMKINTNPDEDVECLYDVLQYLETLHPNSEQFKIAEPLERVQLIMNIRNYLHDAENSNHSALILDIHDTLLQISTLGNNEIIKSLPTKCIDHMCLGGHSDEEVQFFYHILEYLKAFHTSTQELIASSLSTSKPFRKVYQKFESQAELQPHLQRYFEKEDKDPYIMSLLLPFVGWHTVELSYVKHCLHILNIQDTALASNKGELYGLDARRVKKYHKDQDLFIEMMYKASVYIEGLQQYLDLQVPRNKKSGHYEFISSVSLANKKETTEECHICLRGYLEGQRVVKLGCYRPHLFHEQCINVSRWICGSTCNNSFDDESMILTFFCQWFISFWVEYLNYKFQGVVSASKTKGAHATCPICRRGIAAPFDQNEHMFWGLN